MGGREGETEQFYFEADTKKNRVVRRRAPCGGWLGPRAETRVRNCATGVPTQIEVRRSSGYRKVGKVGYDPVENVMAAAAVVAVV